MTKENREEQYDPRKEYKELEMAYNRKKAREKLMDTMSESRERQKARWDEKRIQSEEEGVLDRVEVRRVEVGKKRGCTIL